MLRRKHLTTFEIEKMLEATANSRNQARNYCLLLMCFLHGARVSEAISWRLSDIDFNTSHIYIHRLKKGFSTVHPLIKREKTALKNWLGVRESYPNHQSDYLFISQKGKPLSRQQVYLLVKQYSAMAELSIRAHPHMLRHSCGYALADRGIDTRLIQDYLGHRNIRHTVIYTASNPERFRNIW
ncbi:MAG: tyrosine-type DNA invertase [Candidatus Symbiodolus clandestinus]